MYLLIVFCVYSCLLLLFCMSANIQFMETVNLLSPDKGDMSVFSGPPYISSRCKIGALGSLSQVIASR